MTSIINDAQGVRQTFSSWDSCMSKAYCKWPAIVGIVLGSIIVLSILWCIASCLCCGATLCGACVKCLTCGSCCGACSKSSGGDSGRRSKHKDDYSQMPPTPYQGYQPQPTPMMYNHNTGPQFATFDAPSKRGGSRINEDSLPAMPSWDNARSVQIEDHDQPAHPHGDDVEMGRMHPPQRGPYNQIPNREPVSPTYNNPYHSSQLYSGDLGSQRLRPSPTNPHGDYHGGAISPMPDHRTTSPLMGQDQHRQYVESDHFAAGTTSPTPNEMYNNQQHFPFQAQTTGAVPRSPVSPPLNDYRGQQYSNYNNDHGSRSYAPFSPTDTAASTRYEPTEYQSYRQAASPPPSFHTDLPNGHQSGGYRPPSLLQAGRKPVNGYTREI